MHEQIFKALHVRSQDRRELRGLLVRMAFETVDFETDPHAFELEHFPPNGARTLADEVRLRVPWTDTTLGDRLYVAIGLSLTFGVALGVLMYASAEALVKRKRKENNKRREANRVMTLLRQYPHLTIDKLRKQLEARDHDEDEFDVRAFTPCRIIGTRLACCPRPLALLLLLLLLCW